MVPDIQRLEAKAIQLRRTALQTAIWGGKGHIPPAFSWADVATVLFYGGILDFKQDEPRWTNRDRFILSKGHACLTLYAALSDLGFFSPKLLKEFAGEGSLLAGHPDIEIPGIEVCSGSLGHGLGVGAGMALSAKLACKNWKTYVVLGDGECHEGSVWEAAMFAGHQKLGGLTAIVDRNGLGATEFTENYASLEPLDDRFASFGWDVISTDGHDLLKLHKIFSESKNRLSTDKPLCVIAHTTKGKGVSYMENSKSWHHQMPKGPQIRQAWDELGGQP
jgi:transketolase